MKQFNENQTEYRLNRLKLLMDDFFDEIPKDIIHSNTDGIINHN